MTDPTLEAIKARQGDALHDIWSRWMAGDELNNRDIQYLITRLEASEAEVESADATISAMHNSLDSMHGKLVTAEAEVGRLREELDDAEEKIHQVRSWANAYPERIFSEPQKDWVEEIGEKIGGEAMTRLHGSWGRHILSGVRDILGDTSSHTAPARGQHEGQE